MDFLGVTIFFSVVVYCATMVLIQKVNLDFHRDKEIERLQKRINELEDGRF